MSIADALIPEFDHEMSNTRRTLERVPLDRADWRPHPKSYTMAQLASHIAYIPNWAVNTCRDDELDFGKVDVKIEEAATSARLLSLFDEARQAAREIILTTSDEEFMKPWSLKAGGHTIFTMPKVAVLRSFVFSHSIHHRAQLTVYLRMNDVPVPAIYGPSADEQ
jgi:uncharacterized damage-inducible protein DinB